MIMTSVAASFAWAFGALQTGAVSSVLALGSATGLLIIGKRELDAARRSEDADIQAAIAMGFIVAGACTIVGYSMVHIPRPEQSFVLTTCLLALIVTFELYLLRWAIGHFRKPATKNSKVAQFLTGLGVLAMVMALVSAFASWLVDLLSMFA